MPLEKPVAIVDIGSNSVRLVVYAGASRIPSVIFNEKVMAGLGRDMNGHGELTQEAQDRALAALRRFHILMRQMEIGSARVVATAAVREASNGAAFLAEVRAIGFEPMTLTGEQEGLMAGQGVLAGIPDADGIVGDLGGGSLELAEVQAGRVLRSASMPLGVLRLAPLIAEGSKAFARRVEAAVQAAGFGDAGQGRPFYLVGGSWRSLARLDMLLADYPLPITHHYEMAPDRPLAIQKAVEAVDKSNLKGTSLTLSRVPTLPRANLLLQMLVEQLHPGRLIVSSFGIREGLLYDDLMTEQRARDPLIEAAREAGRGLGRFTEHGDLLDRWIAPIFDDDGEYARLRLAACLLGDIAWAAHPDFRAERGVDMALHGNWVGVDAPGRVMMAAALSANFGGGRSFAEHPAARLCSRDQLDQAGRWGLAMRLGQRLSGGVAASLERSRLAIDGEALRLTLREEDAPLYGETVERRHETLAKSLGLKAETG